MTKNLNYRRIPIHLSIEKHMKDKKHYFKVKQIVTPLQTIQGGLIGFQGGTITHIGDSGLSPLPPDSILHAFPDKMIIPGLIDIHLHGYGGYGGFGLSRGEGIISHEMIATEALSRLLPKFGVTAFLPTISSNFTAISSVIGGIMRACGFDNTSFVGARILGINLEGPFLNPACAGALNARGFCLPSKSLFQEWSRQSSGKLVIMTLAPELPGADEIIQASRDLGIVPAIGHSSASYEKVEESIELGLSHATHAFNAMKGFHHRSPGVVGALLLRPELTAELIADGFHLHWAAIKLLLLAKGWEKIILVSDSIPWGGLPDGRYRLYGTEDEFITIREGKCTLPDGRLAGSLLTIKEGVMKMVSEIQIPLNQALAMASINPAKVLNLDREIGSLEVGKSADFVVIDEYFRIYLTVVGGRVAYNSGLNEFKSFGEEGQLE